MSKTDPQIEELLIDYLDGTLGGSKKALVERYLAQHPDVAEEISAFNEIRLSPDEKLVYEGKESLKRVQKERSFPFILRYAVAAGGALLIGLAMWLNMDTNISPANTTAMNQSGKSAQEHIDVASQSSNTSARTKELAASEAIAASDSKTGDIQTTTTSTTTTSKQHRTIIPKQVQTQFERNSSAALAKIQNDEVLASNGQTLTAREKIDIVFLSTPMPESLSSTQEQSTPYFIAKVEPVYTPNTSALQPKVMAALLPENYLKMKNDVRKAIAENTVHDISGKVKTFFSLEKIKEAIVPTLAQQEFTSPN